MASTLYAMASWSGERAIVKFRDDYVEKHIEQLERVEHNLTQISIGNPENPKKRITFDAYIKNLTDCNGTPIVVHNVPNIGRSYGQWSRIYQKYRNKFDYYIFIEDDYAPAIDNFDTILIDLFEKAHKDNNVGFLCGVVFDETGRYETHPVPMHAGITNGITSAEVLEKVWEKCGVLPHDLFEYDRGQIKFSQGFLEAGFNLGEYVSEEYRCLYFQHDKAMRNYGPNPEGKDIFVPIQFLGNEARFSLRHITEDMRPSAVSKQPRPNRTIGQRNRR
jgi:hypothetical protein